MIHILRLAEVGICKLQKVNILVKKFYKQFLHLPEWTPDSWVHHVSIPIANNILVKKR